MDQTRLPEAVVCVQRLEALWHRVYSAKPPFWRGVSGVSSASGCIPALLPVRRRRRRPARTLTKNGQAATDATLSLSMSPGRAIISGDSLLHYADRQQDENPTTRRGSASTPCHREPSAAAESPEADGKAKTLRNRTPDHYGRNSHSAPPPFACDQVGGRDGASGGASLSDHFRATIFDAII